MLAAIIICSVAFAGNSYCYIDRLNFYETVFFNKEGNFLEVLILINELLWCQIHLLCTSIRYCCFCSSAEGEVFFSVQWVADLNIIAFYFMFFSIVVNRC